MTTDLFQDSTDAVRSARPLKHVQYFNSAEPLQLELGGQIPGITVAYETYGRLSEENAHCRLLNASNITPIAPAARTHLITMS